MHLLQKGKEKSLSASALKICSIRLREEADATSMKEMPGRKSLRIDTKSYLRRLAKLRDNPRLSLIMLSKMIHKSACSRFLRDSARKKMNGVVFDFDFTLDPRIVTMYFGLYEPDLTDCLKRLLKRGDIFFDVGANIGYISALAAGRVGTNGEVHSFEPVPEYFQKLKMMADQNSTYTISANACGLGERRGFADIEIPKNVSGERETSE